MNQAKILNIQINIMRVFHLKKTDIDKIESKIIIKDTIIFFLFI